MSDNKNSTSSKTKKIDDFYIVGIGASAGGLGAFESFFSGMPTEYDANVALVLIQHLDPNHKSLLTELIQRYTKMKVHEVKDGMTIDKNSVYIIPPKHDIKVLDGILQLVDITKVKGQHLPIDTFFNSLAKDKKNKAIGIVLSGTGKDGSKGLQSISKAGGITMVQNPKAAEFSGMPSSAIGTNVINEILLPNEMPKMILNYVNGTFNSQAVSKLSQNEEEVLQKLFVLLQSQTSHDFSMYKVSTIRRRIERRLVVNKVDTLQEYYQYLQRSKKEVDTLFHDLLIGVTSFFRDESVFISLEKNVIAKLFSDKLPGANIRVWIPGCSTGEEAYSIAILIAEYMQTVKENYVVQIFATDIDETAISSARSGRYALNIAESISKERLDKYFKKSSDGNSYKIDKNIRNMLIFSVHDVIKDPPFSRLDLVSCRNLLIYMNIDLQQKLISLFHYALNFQGYLLLGNSETLGELANLYTLVDAKSKIFKCQKNPESSKQIIMNRLTPIHQELASFNHFNAIVPSVKLPLRELTENAILEQIASAAVLVNEQGDILYIHGRAGMYLELPSGEMNTNNILKMARPGLQNDLILAFHKATTKKQIVHCYGLHVKTSSDAVSINMTIRMVNLGVKIQSELPLYLILLEENFSASKEFSDDETSALLNVSDKEPLDENLQIRALKQELQLQKEFLQDANEKLETSNEELKSYNEEIQSMNEELQSTNEELETSKEELQSVNEELSTVNSELNTKVMDLSRSNNDMNNLLAGTGIGTIFVDHDLSILRFTPAVTRIINLIPSDVGRPIRDISPNIVDYKNLIFDIQSVLDSLIPKELEVMTVEKKYFLMRIQPYRTLENVIEGAVISFVDMTEMHTIKEDLKKAEELSHLAIVVRDSSDAIVVEDLNAKVIAWNPGATKLYGWSESQALKMKAKSRIPTDQQEKHESAISKLGDSSILQSVKATRLKKDGTRIEIHLVATNLLDSNGEKYATSFTERAL